MLHQRRRVGRQHHCAVGQVQFGQQFLRRGDDPNVQPAGAQQPFGQGRRTLGLLANLGGSGLVMADAAGSFAADLTRAGDRAAVNLDAAQISS